MLARGQQQHLPWNPCSLSKTRGRIFGDTGMLGARWSLPPASVSPRTSLIEASPPSPMNPVGSIINRQGKTLIRPYLLDNGPDPFREGLARFREAGKVGFFDERGKVVIRARFAFAAPFSEGRAVFCQGCREQEEGEHRSIQGGLWGFIDRKGRIVITPRFDKAESFQEGKARVMLNGRWITIDRQGRRIKMMGE